MDRRAGFFLIAAVMCFVLTPVADTPHRPIAIITGSVYVVLAALSALDRASRNAMERRPAPLHLETDEAVPVPTSTAADPDGE
jgi:hypothetical protein